MAKIPNARPRLSLVAPLTNSIVWGYVFFNLLIAFALYTQKDSRTLVIYSDLVTPVVWAVVFVLLALMMFYGEVRNNWSIIRKSFIIALAVKAIFAYALLYLAYKTSFTASVGTLSLWGLAAFTQAAVLIYFPHISGERNARQ